MYKPSEFARKTGVCLKTLQRWDIQGLFPAKRTPTGTRFYTEEDLQKYFGQKEKSKMKILQISNAPDNSYVLFHETGGFEYRAPIVALGLVDENGLTYVSPLILDNDGQIELLAKIEMMLESGVKYEAVWNDKRGT